ncbi:MAG TPA: ABC transporter substrate-binding protein [Casimicrobiaceae bacterium]|jgi:NitT/TauT family transport system substrate-binding protein|nr:ABC transporter substrate-binding protein [Casimicrobiaceae bacterium]
MSKRGRFCTAIAAVLIAMTAPAAQAEDTLRVAAGQRGNWDTTIAEIGQRGGIFKKNGLSLEILYTQGGGETQQAVISGSVEIGVAPGIMGVLSAFSKGAPVRIIGAETTGAADLFWYVPSNSPIKSLKDTDGKTIAYSTNGSSTHGIVTAFMKQYDLKARPTATGGPAPTLTQVMSNQIDVGWSAPPFGLQQLDEGKIRIIAVGNDATVFKGQTVRLLITNVQTLQERKPVIERFMKAYRETIDWLYSDDPAALKTYADFVGISVATAKRTRDGFFPKAAVDPDAVVGLDQITQDAVTLKYTAAPLTKEQLAELIQIPPRR